MATDFQLGRRIVTNVAYLWSRYCQNVTGCLHCFRGRRQRDAATVGGMVTRPEGQENATARLVRNVACRFKRIERVSYE